MVRLDLSGHGCHRCCSGGIIAVGKDISHGHVDLRASSHRRERRAYIRDLILELEGQVVGHDGSAVGLAHDEVQTIDGLRVGHDADDIGGILGVDVAVGGGDAQQCEYDHDGCGVLVGEPGEPSEVPLSEGDEASVETLLALGRGLLIGRLVGVDVAGPEDPVSHEVEEGGDECERSEERDEDSQSEDHPHGLDQGERAQCEGCESDHDGNTGCGDGLSAPHDGLLEGGIVALSLLALVSVPCDDEDGVVAARTEHDDQEQDLGDVEDTEELPYGVDEGQRDSVGHSDDHRRNHGGDDCIEEQSEEDEDQQNAERIDLGDILSCGDLGIVVDSGSSGDVHGYIGIRGHGCLGILHGVPYVPGLVGDIGSIVACDGEEHDPAAGGGILLICSAVLDGDVVESLGHQAGECTVECRGIFQIALVYERIELFLRGIGRDRDLVHSYAQEVIAHDLGSGSGLGVGSGHVGHVVLEHVSCLDSQRKRADQNCEPNHDDCLGVAVDEVCHFCEHVFTFEPHHINPVLKHFEHPQIFNRNNRTAAICWMQLSGCDFNI